MQNYLDLLNNVMKNGASEFNERTKKTTRFSIGEQIRFNLADGFPAVTTKQLFFKSMVGELLGFFRGYTSAADFRALGCKIWDANANLTPAWLANPNRLGEDHLGRIYGAQWTNWVSTRIVHTIKESHELALQGYAVQAIDPRGSEGCYVMQKSINQLENALRTIIENPTDRRIIVSGWNVGELDLMALPPCHMDYRFVPTADNKLHVVMTIRSWDLFLGAPFNIAETALFLAIMARLSGREAGIVTVQATNAHIYEDHLEQVRKQLQRSTYALPQLELSDRIVPVTGTRIKGVFERIEPADIALRGYNHHLAIQAPMAV